MFPWREPQRIHKRLHFVETHQWSCGIEFNRQKMTLNQNDGKIKVWWKKRNSSSRCPADWTQGLNTAANATGTLAFMDDFTAEGSNRMNAEVYRGIQNLTGHHHSAGTDATAELTYLSNWKCYSTGDYVWFHASNIQFTALWQNRSLS